MSSSREGSTQQSVAQSLREATQLLLLAAERLDPSGSRPHDSTRGDSVAGPSRSVRECLRSDSIRDNSNSRFSRSTPTTGSTTSATGDTPLPLFQPLQHRSRRRHMTAKKYRPYSEKKWQHAFVCLSQVGQFIPPDTADRVRLVQAGLGERRVSCSLESSAEALHQELLSAFPRLRDGGGYEFLKLDETSRKQLSVVPPPLGGYNPSYLRAIFLQAKIFIRPLQRNLDLTPMNDEVSLYF